MPIIKKPAGSEPIFQVHLLGGYDFILNDQAMTHTIPHKGRALLAMLMLGQTPLSRKSVAIKLWPNKSMQHALGSLRTLLSTLKNKTQLAGFIVSDNQEIMLHSNASFWCDAAVFQREIKRLLIQKPFDLDTLRHTLDLYMGSFMLGFPAMDSPFDEWLDRQRFTLEKLATRALSTVVEAYDSQNDPKTAVEYAYRLLDLDPWQESTNRQIMRLLARQGRAGAAWHQFERCQALLQRDLGIPPEEETIQLAHRIRRGEIPVVQPTILPALPQDHNAPFLVPNNDAPFIGRTQVVARLQTALIGENSGRRYCLTGLGGVGKTAVAIRVAHLLREQFPDGVLWADCLNRTPLEIATQWADACDVDLSDIVDERARLAALRALLAPKRILLILNDIQNAAFGRELIPKSEKTAVLLTTRNAEMAHLLHAQTIRLEELTPENGRSLFIHLIGKKRAAEGGTAVQRICAQLHNLPLAITIAGNYLIERPHRPLADFARQLQNETERLSLTHANRQVRATFNISWTALHPQEKIWFGLLGLFKGCSFTVEEFAAVSDLVILEAEAQLQHFTNLSLLRVNKHGSYFQHPLLAAFAQEKLNHLKTS